MKSSHDSRSWTSCESSRHSELDWRSFYALLKLPSSSTGADTYFQFREWRRHPKKRELRFHLYKIEKKCASAVNCECSLILIHMVIRRDNDESDFIVSRHLWHCRNLFRCFEELYWTCWEEKHGYDENIGEFLHTRNCEYLIAVDNDDSCNFESHNNRAIKLTAK